MIHPSVISWSAPASCVVRRGRTAPEQIRRLALAQRQVGRAEHQPADARASREPCWRRRPRRERPMHVPGEIARQRRQRLLSRRCERVDVVQDESQIVGGRDHDLVADCLHLIRHVALEIEAGPEAREALAERGAHVGEQPGTGEALVTGAPGPRNAQPGQRLGQQRRLPVAGPGDHDDGSRLEPGDHAPDQLISMEVMRREAAAVGAASAGCRWRASLRRRGAPGTPARRDPRSQRLGASAHQGQAPRP